MSKLNFVHLFQFVDWNKSESNLFRINAMKGRNRRTHTPEWCQRHQDQNRCEKQQNRARWPPTLTKPFFHNPWIVHSFWPWSWEHITCHNTTIFVNVCFNLQSSNTYNKTSSLNHITFDFSANQPLLFNNLFLKKSIFFSN